MGEDEDSAGWRHDELDNCDCFVHDSAVIGMPKNPVEPSSDSPLSRGWASPAAQAKVTPGSPADKADSMLTTN